MECKTDSKKYCMTCKHYDYCDKANRCNGECHKCDEYGCENNPEFSMMKRKKIEMPELYRLCNKEQLFTSGDTNQYNKMFELAKSGITQTEFAYNANGTRISKTFNSTTTNYVLDGNRVLGETTTTATETKNITYYYCLDGITTLRVNGANYYYRKNIQGDVTHIYDTSGVLKAQYAYDAWATTRFLR